MIDATMPDRAACWPAFRSIRVVAGEHTIETRQDFEHDESRVMLDPQCRLAEVGQPPPSVWGLARGGRTHSCTVS